MFTFNDNRYTHMPFACPDENGNPKEFCCILTGGAWKLHHFTGKRWKRIKTGLPDDAFECGPCAEFEDGMWKLSFVAGGAKSDRRFRLYRMPGFDAEPMVQVAADVGFVWKDRVVHDELTEVTGTNHLGSFYTVNGTACNYVLMGGQDQQLYYYASALSTIMLLFFAGDKRSASGDAEFFTFTEDGNAASS